MNKTRIALIAAFLSMVNTLCMADDWPGFRGINRDGKSAETGLLKKWPKGGPKLLWTKDGIGHGYSSAAIAEGSIYVTGLVETEGLLTALDLKGKVKWKINYGPEWHRSMPGVRCTPTIEDNRVYIISGMGRVSCLDAITGKQIWSVEGVQDHNGKPGPWGIAESALIDRGNVICTPGGDEATVMALDKLSGKLVWTCVVKGQKNACCSPIVIERGGKRIIVTMLEDFTIAIDADTGKLLWKDAHEEYQEKVNGINPVSPIYHQGCIFTTSGYDDGSAMLQLNDDGSKFTRKWTETTLDCHHGGVVLVDGFLYGSNYTSVFKGDWACLEWETGKEMYLNQWNNKGSIIFADSMLYCYDEKEGEAALLKPNSAAFEVVSSFKVPYGEGMHWAHPAISDGKLYIRHGDALGVYDIKKSFPGIL